MNAYPTAISTDGTHVIITGTIGDPSEMRRRPVMWIDGEFKELPVLPGHEPGTAVPKHAVAYKGQLLIGGTASNMATAVPVLCSADPDAGYRPQLNILPFHSTYGGST